MNERDFEQMVEQNYARLRRAALLLTNGNSWEADDLAQEVLLQATLGWASFRNGSDSATWLYSILINQIRMRRRADGRLWRRCLSWFALNPDEPQRSSPDSRILEDELRGTLWKRVSSLPNLQCEVIVLRFAEGLSYEQIAEITGCPIGTVKSRLHTALSTLQKDVAVNKLAAMERSFTK